jgi:hypothetical protein
MLILGEPGSGKTTTLLELTEDILNLAEFDASQPIPVVLNLSSWAAKQLPIFEWLIEELNVIYEVNKDYLREWLKSDPIRLMLDGLDEVDVKYQEACVNAINEFRQEYGLIDIVVCSRITDYERIGKRLNFSGAIRIQPLSLEQINDYLDSAGDQLSAVRAIIEIDEELQEFANTPLNLSIMSLAYREKYISELEIEDKSLRANHLFQTYIQSITLRKTYLTQKYSLKQITQGLSWLADNLQNQSLTIFHIEQIHRDWLMSKKQRMKFNLLGISLSMLIFTVSMVTSVTIGLFVFLTVARNFYSGDATSSNGISITPISLLLIILLPILLGLVVGLIVGVPMIREGSPKLYVSAWSMTRAKTGFGLGCAPFSLIIFLSTLGIMELIYEDITWIAWLIACLMTTLFIYFLWKKFLRFALVSGFQEIIRIGFGRLLLIVILCPLSILPYSFPENNSWVLLFLCAPMIWGMIGLVTFGIGGSGEIIKESAYPNQGVWNSLKNGINVFFLSLFSLQLFILITSFPWVLLAPDISSTEKISMSLLVWAIFVNPISTLLSLALAYRSGLNTFIYHFSIRLILSKNKVLPWKLVEYLNYLVDNLFLRQVGGGYIFVHRMLLEHFADLDK